MASRRMEPVGSNGTDAIIALKSRRLEVCSLQEWHALAREMVG